MSPLVLWNHLTQDWDPLVGSGTIPDPDPPSGTSFGWLLNSTNTGLAGAGVTEAMLTDLSVPQYGGAFPNISGTNYRRRINLGSNLLAPATNTVLEECLITGSNDLVNLFGDNVTIKNCTFHIDEGSPNDENVHINGNYAYVGEGARALVQGCQFTGGHIFVNLTSMGGDIVNCYGHSQSPEVGGLQHRDGFTSRGASANNPIRLSKSRFDCDQNSTTGAFFLQDTYGSGVSGVEVRDCMFEGAGYCVAIENATNLTFVNNRIRQHGSWMVGALTTVGNTSSWVWSDNNLYADTPPEYRGTVINKP